MNKTMAGTLAKIATACREQGGNVIFLLQETQGAFGYVPKEAVEYFSEELGIASSKFKDVAGYADKIATPILLQDHSTVAWFRSLKIRPVPAR